MFHFIFSIVSLKVTCGPAKPEKFHGTVKAWNGPSGFGFIQTTGMDDLFVHVYDLIGVEALSVGDHVEYFRGFDERNGKEMAKEVIEKMK